MNIRDTFTTCKNDQYGFSLVFILVIFISLASISVVISQLVVSNYAAANRDVSRLQSQMAVDSGFDIAIEELNADNSWAGTGGEIELFNDSDRRVTYEVEIVEGLGTEAVTLESYGRTYRPADSTTPATERSFKVFLRGIPDETGGTHSVVTGVGGLYMSNNAKIVGGDVTVNGEVSMSNNAQIGLSSNPINMEVAHQNCPSGGGSDYPQVCAEGENGQPISQTNNSYIYGEVQATNQTVGSRMGNPGLVSGSPEPAVLPDHDRATQKSNVETTVSGSPYTDCNNNTVTWSGQLKIEGSVNLSGKCRIYLEGDVWISGSLNLSNSAEIVVIEAIPLGGQNTVNENLPTIMIDDTVNLSNNTEIVSNSDGIGAQLITFKSNASCSPDCVDLTGTDLYSSRNDQTINISNNAAGPGSVFYARWTQAQLSNGGAIGAIAGQTVRLSNGAAITFGAAVGGGSGDINYTYVVANYLRSF